MFKKLYHGKIYYGWIIVFATFIIMANSMGIINNTASLFLKPISDDLGFTRSAISATFTIRFVVQMIVSLFSWKIFTKYNLRNVMKVSAIVMVLSFFSYSLVDSLPSIYIISVIVSLSFTLINILPLSLILNNWFNDRIGTVMGIAFMGSGIGGMLFNSLAGKWIFEYGWRTAYQILAFIMFLTIIPCIFFIIRIHPRDIGLEPLGESSKSNENMETQNSGSMLGELIKTYKFWVLIICSMLLAMSINTLIMTISPHLTDMGYTITYSANIVALCMGAIALGKVLLGYLYDKIGVKLATIISCLSTLIGLIGLINFNSYFTLLILIIGAGISGPYGNVGSPIIAQKLYGKRDYSAIYGIVFAANTIGIALGPMLIGYIHDLTGNYLLGFKLMLIIAFLTMVTYSFILEKEKSVDIKFRSNI